MRRIVMIGSDFAVRGGVSAMTRVCADHGLFERCDAVYLATHCDGSAPAKAVRAARAWLAFMGMLLTGRVALLHAHVNSGASFWRKSLFIVPALLLRIPYVAHVHCGAFPAFFHERCSPRAQRFVRWVLRRARAVVALSEGSREALAGIGPGLRIEVIPNPVEIPPWHAPLDGATPTVLFLGVIRESKGAFDLLRAWPAVRAEIPGVRLVLGGVGEIEKARASAREHGFDHELSTPGWVVDGAKAALLREAWVLALPSHWEAMPMSVLEAMAAGIPVVATRVGAIPSMVAEGETGLLVDVRDPHALAAALTALLRDTAGRRAMGRAARARAAALFSADCVVPRIEALWREILRGRGLAGLATTRG